MDEVSVLKLQPYLMGKTDKFEPSDLNKKSRSDITGLELKPGQTVAYAWISKTGFTATQLTIGKIMEYGPRGGAKVCEILVDRGKIDSSTANDMNATYVGETLVLDESLENRLIMYRLKNK